MFYLFIYSYKHIFGNVGARELLVLRCPARGATAMGPQLNTNIS